MLGKFHQPILPINIVMLTNSLIINIVIKGGYTDLGKFYLGIVHLY